MRNRLGVLRAKLRDLGLVILLTELGIDLLDDAALVVALEARDHVLAGLVVRRHHVDVVHARVLQELAHGLGRLVVVPGGREVELVALAARERACAGVRADHDLARAVHDRRHGHHHVRPDDSGDEVDVVLLQHLLGDLHADIGLGLIIAVDHLHLHTADLAAEMIERELDRVPHVAADHALRSAHRGDEADLELCCCANAGAAKATLAASAGDKVSDHVFLLGKYSSIKTRTYAV